VHLCVVAFDAMGVVQKLAPRWRRRWHGRRLGLNRPCDGSQNGQEQRANDGKQGGEHVLILVGAADHGLIAIKLAGLRIAWQALRNQSPNCTTAARMERLRRRDEAEPLVVGPGLELSCDSHGLMEANGLVIGPLHPFERLLHMGHDT